MNRTAQLYTDSGACEASREVDNGKAFGVQQARTHTGLGIGSIGLRRAITTWSSGTTAVRPLAIPVLVTAATQPRVGAKDPTLNQKRQYEIPHLDDPLRGSLFVAIWSS